MGTGGRKPAGVSKLLLSGDAHARRPLHKMDGVFFFFFRFVGQLLEHPVWRHLQLPAHSFYQFSGKFEKSCSLISQTLNLRDDFLASV